MDKQIYVPRPIDVTEVVFPAELEGLREAIAENTHEVWAAGRIKEGWTYGPERDDKLKTHPDLIPYAELTEGEKQYDRETAENAIKLVIKLGFEIRKRRL